jgi:hypothetical protein
MAERRPAKTTYYRSEASDGNHFVLPLTRDISMRADPFAAKVQ